MGQTRYIRFFESWLKVIVTFLQDEEGKSFIKTQFEGHDEQKEGSIGDLEILLKEANVPFENNKFEYILENEPANRFIELFQRF